jgi:carbonic anhydrase/acetyltransferase-like protein (isoleucine patch superfamily)
MGTITLYRIRALKDLPMSRVKAGDYGGWVSGEYDLSQEGNCWIYDEARVFGDAFVCDNARMYGNAWAYDEALVCGNARINDNAHVYGMAWVYGNARVYENSRVYGNAQVYDEAQVHGNAYVYDGARVCGRALASDNARVYGDAFVSDGVQVCDDAWVFGDVHVYGKAWIRGHARISHAHDLLTVGGLGSGYDWLTICKDAKTGVGVSSIGFSGSLDGFAAKAREVHGNNAHARAYNALIELARVWFADALTGCTEQEGGSA